MPGKINRWGMSTFWLKILSSVNFSNGKKKDANKRLQ
jgi:hypothetical protein